MIEIVLALMGTGILGLIVAFKLQGKKLNEQEKKAKELGFRLEVIAAQDEIKELERKSRESGAIADTLYDKYFNSRTGEWRPGSDDPKNDK